MEIHGKIVDLCEGKLFAATVTVEGNTITRIKRNSHRGAAFILPGFVDAYTHFGHTHLTPEGYAKIAVRHGTVAVHCAAAPLLQALSSSEFDLLVRSADSAPIKFSFSNGERPFPKAFSESHEIEEPMLFNEENMLPLLPLLQDRPELALFATRFMTPDQLQLGHINQIVRKAVQHGMDPFDAIASGTIRPIEICHLAVGSLREGDPADFILVEDLTSFRVLETYIDGVCVFKGRPLFTNVFPLSLSPPKIRSISTDMLAKATGKIEVATTILTPLPTATSNSCKIVAIPRDPNREIAVGHIEGFGPFRGALATSVSHPNHDWVAIGSSDQEIGRALHTLAEGGGGIALVRGNKVDYLPLPHKGIFAAMDGEELARCYADFSEMAKDMGAEVRAPLLTLSLCSSS